MDSLPRVLLHHDRTAGLAAALSARVPGIPLAECNDYPGLPAAVSGFRPDVVYSVRFAGSAGFPRDALFGPDGPKWVANGGAGTDHFGTWDPAQTTVTNAAGVAAAMMAEYVIGTFLHFSLDIPGLQADKQRRAWRAREVRPLKGGSLVIVGLGQTGQAIAALARSFGMHVAGTRARPRPMENVDEVAAPEALHQLLAGADFIAVSTPLTAATRGLIGAAEFAAMKPGALFADVSRGGVVDQMALAKALRDGRLAGAASDVFETEPLPPDSPLWAEPNLLVSPHCSSVYEGWEDASFDLFLDNLDRWMRSEPLRNVVDPVRGY